MYVYMCVCVHVCVCVCLYIYVCTYVFEQNDCDELMLQGFNEVIPKPIECKAGEHAHNGTIMLSKYILTANIQHDICVYSDRMHI